MMTIRSLGVYMASPIQKVITERNILTPLRLFIMTSPINKAVASGKGYRLFTEKQHVQRKGDLITWGVPIFLCFIQNGANFAQPLLWVPKIPHKEKKNKIFLTSYLDPLK
jgi:hypothetical protein